MAPRIIRLLARNKPLARYDVLMLVDGEVRERVALPGYQIAAKASEWADLYGECVAEAFDRRTGALVQSVTVTRET